MIEKPETLRTHMAELEGASTQEVTNGHVVTRDQRKSLQAKTRKITAEKMKCAGV